MTFVTKRCTVCARFRGYEVDDRYCVVCGHDALEGECACGRRSDSRAAERCSAAGKKSTTPDQQRQRGLTTERSAKVRLCPR